MEQRTLCWGSNPSESDKLVLLTYGKPYEIDYYTSTYFQNTTQIRNAYQQEIKSNQNGTIVVCKKIDGKEKKIAPICANHIQYLHQLLPNLQYLQALEKIDSYNACKKKMAV